MLGGVDNFPDELRPYISDTDTWSGLYENLEGEAHEHHVIFEFNSFAEAKRFYESPKYQAAKALRVSAATGTFVLVEEYS